MARAKIIEKKQKELEAAIGIPSQVFTPQEFRKLFKQLHESFILPAALNQKSFVEFMSEHSMLNKVDLDFPWRKFPRFIWGKVDPLKLIQTLEANKGYFSHFTAAKYHGLTLQVPKSIFFNVEQSPKPPGSGLSQLTIDRAFKSKPRETKQIASYEDKRVVFLMGKQTSNLGVMDVELKDGSSVKMTDIERTLIDSVTRPQYCGGPHEVGNIYKEAIKGEGQISINKIRMYLKKLNYIYPFHQAIGFLLERAGANSKIIDIMQSELSDFDFYFGHKIPDPEYSKRWRLYFPKSL